LIATEQSPASLHVSLRPIQTINARHLQPIAFAAVYFTENDVRGDLNVGESERKILRVRILAELFQCGKTQVSTILKDKKAVKKVYESNASSGLCQARKRNQTSEYADLNDAMFQ
jgi:hypothetical protein